MTMLIAISSGFLDDDGLCEIVAGKTRIAPELLAQRPQYAEFFEADVRTAGLADSERGFECRAFCNGNTVAY